MSKIALITDQHFGVRGDNQVFLDYQKDFYDKIFFPYLIENNIKTVIDLGDTFDRRKYINFNTLYSVKHFYFRRLFELGITLHVILGNHSVYYKNTNDVNSPDLVLSEFNNIITYGIPQSIEIDGLKILMMPWINNENVDICKKSIIESMDHIMLGHLEITDEILRGRFKFEQGIGIKDIAKFENVLSGHYHHKITKKNFQYLGAPYEMDWSDVNTKKGFHIIDTETHSIKFIPNTLKIFKKIKWEDINPETDSLTDYTNKFVKIIVGKKENPYIFDKFIESIESTSPHNLIIEEMVLSSTDDEDITQVEDTLTILKKYIEKNIGQDDVDLRENLLYLMEDLYNEALTLHE